MYSPHSAIVCGGTGVSTPLAGGAILIIMIGHGAAGMVSAGALGGVPGGDPIIGTIRLIGPDRAIGAVITIGGMLILRAGLMGHVLRMETGWRLLPTVRLLPCAATVAVAAAAAVCRHRAMHAVAAVAVWPAAGW